MLWCYCYVVQESVVDSSPHYLSSPSFPSADKPQALGMPGGFIGILGVVVVAGLIVGVIVTICMVYRRGQKPRTETDNDLWVLGTELMGSALRGAFRPHSFNTVGVSAAKCHLQTCSILEYIHDPYRMTRVRGVGWGMFHTEQLYIKYARQQCRTHSRLTQLTHMMRCTVNEWSNKKLLFE